MKTLTLRMTVIAVLFSFFTLTALSVFADNSATPPTAPPVVAPAQPAAAANVAATGAIGVVPGTAAAPAQQGGLLQMALPFIIMLTVMYFLMIRPQQKKMKEQQSLLSGLQSGDEVITNSGILGTITGMSEKVVNLEIAKNVQIKILKSQVNQVVKGNIQDIKA